MLKRLFALLGQEPDPHEPCPVCGIVATEAAARIRELEEENAQLLDELGRLEDEVSERDRGLVASSHRRRFHKDTCDWAKFILESPRLIEFSSRAEAIEAGYKPCGTCVP